MRLSISLILSQDLFTIPDLLEEPVKLDGARRLIREILEEEQVTFPGHAEDAVSGDGLSTVDAANVLRVVTAWREKR